MACKGVCHKYRAKCGLRKYRYASGQKRCNICEIFVQLNDHSCPCCGMLLRTRPKSGKAKIYAKNRRCI